MPPAPERPLDAPTPERADAYPLHLDLSGRRVLVVGGGPVALRRTEGLLHCGAVVHLVAPQVCEGLAELAAAGALTWRQGVWRPDDLDGAWLVHTATGEPGVDAAVAAAAERQRTWCVRADDAAASSAWTPSVVRRDDVTVSVTAGGDPDRSRRLRQALASALDRGALPLRRRRSGRGGVTLVGGGPGDPDLITLRGRRALAEADVVVVDRLAPTGVLAELEEDVQVVDVGKTPDHHPVPQHEINRILVEAARAGNRVVRLKGGDNYVLGRGGEEVAACRDAGVPVEVVPGVTSAFAVPAAAGIPVTHRGLSRAVTVVSGHEHLDHEVLARLEGTLVVLMGVSTLGELAAGLLAHGRDPATPVAVVENGCTPRQRTTRAPLADIAQVAADRGVRAPAVIVVGAVAALGAEVADLQETTGRQETTDRQGPTGGNA